MILENFKVITINNPIDNIKVERKEIHISLKEIAEVITICEMESQKNNPDFNIVASGWLHLLNHLPVPMYYYDISHSVIRARANVDDEIFKHIDDISYNKTKPHLCKLGRFNLEGEGIFYGAVPTSNEVSNGSVTTIVESYKELLDSKNVEISKYFTLGKWIVKKKFPLAVLTFSKDAYGKSPEVKNTNPIYTDFLNQMYSPENI